MTAGKMQKPYQACTHAQDILYIMTQGNWLPSKVSQIGLEPGGYVVTNLTGTIDDTTKHIRLHLYSQN